MSAKRITWTARVGQVAMLERAAATLNNVPWCQSDNTAETVFDEFIKPCINDIFDDVEMFIYWCLILRLVNMTIKMFSLIIFTNRDFSHNSQITPTSAKAPHNATSGIFAVD